MISNQKHLRHLLNEAHQLDQPSVVRRITFEDIPVPRVPPPLPPVQAVMANPAREISQAAVAPVSATQPQNVESQAAGRLTTQSSSSVRALSSKRRQSDAHPAVPQTRSFAFRYDLLYPHPSSCALADIGSCAQSASRRVHSSSHSCSSTDCVVQDLRPLESRAVEGAAKQSGAIRCADLAVHPPHADGRERYAETT